MQCALAAAAAGGPEVETALAAALEEEEGGQHAAAGSGAGATMLTSRTMRNAARASSTNVDAEADEDEAAQRCRGGETPRGRVRTGA